jgi:hypothetical protein
MERPPIVEGIAQAARRPLKIFASDPLMGHTFGNRARIDVPNEPLQPGPEGRRLEVIDYDGSQGCYYPPVDLDNSAILMQGGLEPSESDPRFHQQMVYAVATKTLENFDRALGLVVNLGSRHGPRDKRHRRLRLLPHAFYGANAFYARELNAVLFGYFSADRDNPGPNLPGQTIFTCLSHDVIAHEMTHAVVDRLRSLFLEPSNVDVLAFHEGFADIIALFQHFSFQDTLREQIQRTRSDLRTPTSLIELARQFGFATGTGRALRSALDVPDAKLLPGTFEPHDRGAILVAAVFDGFFKTYERRINDLIRIATGGSGTLPPGDLHPDLVNRVASEASKTAQRVLDMCIRAFNYMPPVDVTFGDFLRAMITADYELIPDDPYDCRGAMIEAFRLRGIYPTGVTSLAEESLLWENVETRLPPLGRAAIPFLGLQFFKAVREFDARAAERDAGSDRTQSVTTVSGERIELDVDGKLVHVLRTYANKNAARLGLDSSLPIQVRGFHPTFRVSPSGRLLIELVAQFAQMDKTREAEMGGLPFRGGCTLIASADGTMRYLIPKSMPGNAVQRGLKEAARARLAQQRAFVLQQDMRSALTPYLTAKENQTRMLNLMSFSALHGG